MTTSFPADQRAACTGGETLVPGELRGFRRWRLSASTPLGLASIRRVGADDGAWGVEEHAECREDYVDEVAVERFLSGDDDVALTESERRAVAALLHASGTAVTPIAERLHVGPERVTRWLALESTGKTA